MDFIDAIRVVKVTCPGAKICGGISNLSFAFRGNDVVREAIHSAFLFHAIKAGLDMGIVNAGQLAVYEEIPPDLLTRVEDVIFNRRPDATERLVEFAGPGQRQRRPAARSISPGARAASTSGWRTRSCTASWTSSSRTSRKRGSRSAAPARRDRRAADGRHAHRRRPVRRRQDVPAAGRQERARDEARRGIPAAVHGGRVASRVAKRHGQRSCSRP